MRRVPKPTVILLMTALTVGVTATGCSSAQAQSKRGPAMNYQLEQMRTITVQGQSTVHVEPEQAVASFQFTEHAKKLHDAHSAVQQRVQKFVDTVVDAGWDQKFIRQSGMRYQPNFDYIQNEGRVFRDFSASVTLTFRTENFKDIQKVLGLAIDYGVKEIRPVQYSVKNPAEHAGKARQQAIANARQKAEELAKSAGADIGQVVTITEGSSGGPAPRMAVRAVQQEASAADSFAKVSPNEVSLSSQITVTWELK